MKQSFFSNDPVYRPYEYRGLKGRWAYWPATSKKAKRTFVLVYGQHATLERIEPIAMGLASYGDVYVVDTPGFGGMESSYKINEKPTLKFMAGHLEHFISNYIDKDRLLTILGMSYGFQIVTQTLADSPDITRRTEHVICFVGFVSHRDLDISWRFKVPLLYIGANIFRIKLTSNFARYILRPTMFRMIFYVTKPLNVQFKNLPKSEIKDYVSGQIWLWLINDFRTHGETAWEFFKKTDLTNLRIKAHVVHVAVPNDHFFDNKIVASELREMYHAYTPMELNLSSHAPLDIDSPDKVKSLLPKEFIQILSVSKNEKAAL